MKWYLRIWLFITKKFSEYPLDQMEANKSKGEEWIKEKIPSEALSFWN